MKNLALKKALLKMVVMLVVVVTIFGVGTIALLGYSINKISSLAQSQSFDLLALEHLIGEKAIVLSQQQKASLTPIVSNLTQASLNPEVKDNFNQQISQILDPTQIQKIKDWQSQSQVQANSILSLGKSAVSQIVSEYSGIPVGVINNGTESVTVWIDLMRGSVTSKDNLIKALSSNP